MSFPTIPGDQIQLKHGITSIDHPLIAVSDMGLAKEQYERLGFIVPPRGGHIEWGTGNWCIMFAQDYLELRGIVDATRPLMGLDVMLNNSGSGLMGVAFGTNNAAASRALLNESGIRVSKFTSLTRNFERPEGWTKPSFELCFPDAAAVTGLNHVVLCEHKTPELIREPSFLEHANGAIGVIEIVGAIDDFDAIEVQQKDFLGTQCVERLKNELKLTITNGQRIRLMRTAEFETEYSRYIQKEIIARPYLGVIKMRVKDITETLKYYQNTGIEFSVVDKFDTIRISSEYACGVILEFSET